jgi:L,D-transpeptidase YcbB
MPLPSPKMRAMKKLIRPSLLAVLLASPTLPTALQSPAIASAEVIGAAAIEQPAAIGAWARPHAEELIQYIGRLDREGLNPANYGPDRLRAAIASGDQAAWSRTADEIFLTLAGDLSGGAVRGRDRVSWYMAPSGLDDAQRQQLLEQVRRQGNVAGALDALLPTHPQYAGLRRALERTDASDTARRDLIRANMERWRWMPRTMGQRHVIVNVPAFTAAIVDDGQVTARHRAIVGAVATPTPQLSATITAVTMNPWWTVPQSIIRTMRGFAGYEVRQGNGYRIVRQPPGPRNALGRLKIEMPNEHAIYLHDTPSQHLFANARRAYSHGCIRTQNVRDFAAILLQPTGGWDRARIDSTIASSQTRSVRLAQGIPVYISYFTAAATNDGDIVIYTDIYGRDARVRQALNRMIGERARTS